MVEFQVFRLSRLKVLRNIDERTECIFNHLGPSIHVNTNIDEKNLNINEDIINLNHVY